MPNLEDYNKKSQYDLNLASMSDQEFTEYATAPETDIIYKSFTEAEKTAFLVRALMVGEDAKEFKKNFTLKQNNMLKDGPDTMKELTNPENQGLSDEEFMYEAYRRILYSMKDGILFAASDVTKYMNATQIFENREKIKYALTGHLNVPLEAEDDLSMGLKTQMIDAVEKERAELVSDLENGKYGKPEENNEELEEEKPEEDINENQNGKNINENKEDVININEINDNVINTNAINENKPVKEEEDFGVHDPLTLADPLNNQADKFDITIKPADPNLIEEAYFAPFDDPNTSISEKRNLLLSYIFRETGENAVRDTVKKIQESVPMRDLLNRYVSVADSEKVLADMDKLTTVFKNVNPQLPEAFTLSQWANAERKKKGQLSEAEKKEQEKKVPAYDPFEGFHFHFSDAKKEKTFDIEKDYERPGIFSQEVNYNEIKNADEWIEEFKEKHANGTVDNDITTARIFAARILADSVRGSKSSLKKPISGEEISLLSKKLLANKMFKNFFSEELSENWARQLIQKHGHGGVIEDEFKKYILKQPAGALDNSEELQRFMPKVIDRIEELQKQFKANGGESCKEMEETMLLRAYVGAGRKNVEKLHSVIPANGLLKTDFRNLFEVEDFRNACYERSARNTFPKGHGGEMIENMFKAEENSVAKKGINEFAVFCKLPYRYKVLQEKAKDIVSSLKDEMKENPKSEATKKYCLEAKAVIAEAIAMESLVRMDEHKDKEVSPTIQDILKGKKFVLNSETFKNTMFTSHDVTEYLGELNAFANTENPKEYLSIKVDALTAAYRKAHPEAAKNADARKAENKAEAKKSEPANVKKNF